MGGINLMVEWLDNGIKKPIKDFHLDPFSAQVCSAASWFIELIDNLHWWWWPVVAKLQSKSQFTSGCSLPVSCTYSWKVCFGVFRVLSESNCKTALYDRPFLLRGQFSPLRFWIWVRFEHEITLPSKFKISIQNGSSARPHGWLKHGSWERDV